MKFEGFYQTFGKVPKEVVDPLVEFVRDNVARAEARSEPPFAKGGMLINPLMLAEPVDSASYEVCSPVMQYIQDTCPVVKGRVPYRAELSFLKPGCSISEHYDARLFHARSERMHIPLVTDKETVFYSREFNHLNWTSYQMEQGHLYRLNNRIPHKVENSSVNWRCHLIVDYLLKTDLQTIPTKDLLNLYAEPNNPLQ